MALITQEKGSLYGGVSQLDAAQRPAVQVEDMINCVPTLDKGTRLRNPSLPIKFFDLNGNVTQPTFPDGLDTVFVYEYDEGDVALTNNTYAYLITKNGGLEIVDMNLTQTDNPISEGASSLYSGLIYRDGVGINYKDADDRTYLEDIQGKSSFAMTTVRDTTFVTNKNTVVKMVDTPVASDYKKWGYLWIKQSELTIGWKYGCSIAIRNVNGGLEYIDVPLTAAIPNDTTAIATAVKDNINATGTRVKAYSDGSLIQIHAEVSGEEIAGVSEKDSFGDTASFGWAHKVEYQTQLPPTYPASWHRPYVQVGQTDKSSFWLTHEDGIWKESKDPSMDTELDAVTMPRIIERRWVDATSRFEYFVEKYNWDERLIGDKETNEEPAFVDRTIKDLFFFRNRLGMLSQNGVTLSEVGFFGNFFRTSVAAVLDSDRINANVESLKSVNLEYSILLEDSVVLFADKAQFRFKGGQILSPASHEITQELAYDVDIAVRPLYMDNKIFFVANRGVSSAVYEMRLGNSSAQNSVAMDLTAHCQSYVDGKIDRISGSSVHGMIFASSHFDYFRSDDPNAPIRLKRNTVYVYNFMDSGGERAQAAWHKWTWNGDLYSAFCLGANFYSMIKRENPLTVSPWILSTGEWIMNKVWLNDGLWIMSPDTLERQNQLEIIPLQPFSEDKLFLDNYNTPIDGYIDFGEWVYGKDGYRSPRGKLQFRTIQLRISDKSEMNVLIKDIRYNKIRQINEKQVRLRKPYVGGNAKNVRIGISNSIINSKGFRLDVVSYEGTITKRATAH